jgi:hypothetical protein
MALSQENIALKMSLIYMSKRDYFRAQLTLTERKGALTESHAKMD